MAESDDSGLLFDPAEVNAALRKQRPTGPTMDEILATVDAAESAAAGEARPAMAEPDAEVADVPPDAALPDVDGAGDGPRAPLLDDGGERREAWAMGAPDWTTPPQPPVLDAPEPNQMVRIGSALAVAAVASITVAALVAMWRRRR